MREKIPIKEKFMQKKNLLIGIFLTLLIGLIPISTTRTKTYANEPFLVTPTHIMSIDNNLFIYDDNSDEITKFAAKTRVKSLVTGQIKKLTTNGTDLFILQNSDIKKIDQNLDQLTSLEFSSYYLKTKILDIAVSDDLFYILTTDGNIDEFTLSGTTLTRIDTLSKDNLFQGSSITLTNIDVVDDILHITSSNKSFYLNPSDESVTEKINLLDSSLIQSINGKFVLTSSNCIIDSSNSNHFDTLCSLAISGFTGTENELYITEAITHKVYVYNFNSATLTDLNLNPEISITEFAPQNFSHIKIKESASLFLKPYSETPWRTISEDSFINIIGEYSTFYYCLITDGEKNEFLFLSKSVSHEILDLGNSNKEFYTTRTVNVYSLPSTVTDEENIILKSLPADTKITTETSSTLVNTNGDSFYVTKVNNEYGFVRSNFLQSTRGTVELTNDCNAKTKRDTILFENADGTGEILALKKGTRITLLEDPAPNKTYLKAEFQDSKGVVFTGYVNSEDIKKDGLSTLQILGLILILLNITVLTVIILIKKQSKKWQIKEQSKPHHLDLN